MSWSKRQNSRKSHSTQRVRTVDPVRPYSLDKRSSFSPLFLYTLLVLLVIFIIPIALVQSAPIVFTQSDWNTEIPQSLATAPFSGSWSEYSTKNTGVVASTIVTLQSVNYTMTQTSDDGATDICVATGCSTAGGFNAGSTTNTTIYDTGFVAYVGLSTTAADGSIVRALVSDAGTDSDFEGINAIAVDASYIYTAGNDSVTGNDDRWRIQKQDILTWRLDDGFNTNGTVISNPNVGPDTEQINAIAIDANFIYLAGVASASGDSKWRIEKRSIVDGSLETAFNTTGILESDPNTNTDTEQINAIAIDANFIYLAGVASVSGDSKWRIEKRDILDGSLVTAFNTTGILESDPNTGVDTEQINAIAINADYIFVGGYDHSQGVSDSQWRIENRDITTGALVTAFGPPNGYVTNNEDSNPEAINAIVLDSRFLYAGGYEQSNGNPKWRIEKRRAKEFVPSGTFQSAMINLGGIQDFGIFRWNPLNPVTNTALTMEVRVSPDAGSTWGSWIFVAQDTDSGITFDGSQYFQYRATFSTTILAITPRMNRFDLDFSNFPVGAGLTSSVFDTGDNGNFLKTISWSETVDATTDIRLQIATSPDNINWNYCGSDICSTSGWLSWSDANNYYESGNLAHLESSDAVGDQYFKYQAWLVSDGTTAPTVDDIITTYDTASLHVLAPDGSSASYMATAGTPFNIVLTARDTDAADVTDHGEVSPITVRLTASSSQPDVGVCTSSFTSNGNREFTQQALMFASGTVTVPNVMLCDSSVTSFSISAQETSGGELASTADLTISVVNLAVGTQLLFSTQPPTTALATVDFIPVPVVSITDDIGNPILSETTAVVLTAWEDALCSSTAASGTFNVTSSGTTAGVATFSNINYNTPESIFIRARASGFSDICSTVIAIVGTGYIVQIDPIYDVDAASLVITTSLLRNGSLITDNANMTLTDVDILDTDSVSVSGGLGGSDVSTVTDAVNSIYHTTWAPTGGLTADSVYSIFSEITYNGVLYRGNVSVNVNQLGVITADLQILDGKVDAIQTTVSSIETKTTTIAATASSLKDKTTAHAASQAAYRALTTASLNLITQNIGFILEDTSKIVPGLIRASIIKELAKGAHNEIVTTQSVVKTGSKIPFRYRTKTGLKPTITVFDPEEAVKVASVAMREIAGTGIYVHDLTFNTAWGLGSFMIRVNEATNQSADHMVINVIKASSTTGSKKAIGSSAVTLDTLFSRLNKINSSMDILTSGVDAVKSNTDTVSTDIEGLLKSVDGSGTSTSTGLSSEVAKFGKYISSVSSVIGSSTSAADHETIMGKLKGIEDSLDGIGIEATAAKDFNRSARAKAERIRRFVTVIMTEFKEDGSIKDAGEKAEILDDYLTELKATVEEIPNAVTTGSIAESVEHTLSELGNITIGKEGLEGLAPLVRQELGVGDAHVRSVLDVQSVESLSKGDMIEMRNDVSGLKSLMLEIRGLLDDEVNAPVVHGWLEGE